MNSLNELFAWANKNPGAATIAAGALIFLIPILSLLWKLLGWGWKRAFGGISVKIVPLDSNDEEIRVPNGNGL